MEQGERERLLARARELEARLERARLWRREQAAEEARLLDALSAQRRLMAKGAAQAYRLSAELSGIRLRLHEAQRAGEGPGAGAGCVRLSRAVSARGGDPPGRAGLRYNRDIAVRQGSDTMRGLVLMLAGLAAATVAAGPLEELAGRVAPGLEGRVRFRVDPGLGAIRIAREGADGVAIAAPGTRLAAAGLGLYLREVAGAHWSWCGNRLEGSWPAPARTLTFEPAFPESVAYNYCTLSYTMAYWDEAAWREELDRLALFGVRRFLVQAGVRKAWQLTLRELGCPEARIAAFLPDEAAAAWWEMGNLEGLGGPVPQTAIDRDAAVGRFVVQEALALGMEPILHGFVGLMPHDAPEWLDKARFPDARFVPQGTWVDGFVRPTVLDPTTRAFRDVAAVWYRNLFKVYGVARAEAFAGDLFHEGGRTGGLDVTACARAVQAAQQAASPGAKWVIQAWGANPRAALLRGLDPGHTLIEALVKNQSSGNVGCRAFGDIPWVWCELVNFGGKHGLCGGAPMVGALGRALESPGGGTLAGLGFLSEGLETNPLIYELLAERLFLPRGKVMDRADLGAWLALYATRRYGLCTPAVHEGLSILLDSAYTHTRDQEGGFESVFCARPSWTARKTSTWSTAEPYYDPVLTLRAAQALLRAARETPALLARETFRYDLADAARQALADLARPLLSRAKEDPAARAAFVEAIVRTDEVLAHEPRWRLDWHEARVRRQGGEAAARAWRRMVSTWTGRRGALNDYAHRQLAGMMGSYYRKRWEAFFAGGEGLEARLAAIDRDFESNGVPGPAPKGDFVEAVAEALAFAQGCHARWPAAFRFAPGVPWDLAAGRMTVDVTDQIGPAGLYEAEILWKRGPNALKIAKVELLENGRPVAEDAHAGYAGIRRDKNVYALRLPARAPGTPAYALRITGEGDGGDRSAGVAVIAPRSGM